MSYIDNYKALLKGSSQATKAQFLLMALTVFSFGLGRSRERAGGELGGGS